METFSVIFLALITRVYSMCSITDKNYQELAIMWKLRKKIAAKDRRGNRNYKEIIAVVFAFAPKWILRKFNSIPTMCV